MVSDEHDGDLLPGRQQLEPQALRALDQPLLGVRVEPVALLEGRGGGHGSWQGNRRTDHWVPMVFFLF